MNTSDVISTLHRPLLPLQQAMALALHLADSSGLETEQLIWHMTRAFPAPALEAAFSAAARRHEALRTTFVLQGGEEPFQEIHPEIPVSIREIEMPATGTRQQQQAIAHFLEEDRAIPLDLAAAPGWRLSLLQFGAGAAALIWTFPHALLDGRSVSLILAEIATELQSAGKTASPPERNGTPYADYLDQRLSINQAEAAGRWAARLRDFSAATDFPRDPAAGGRRRVAQEMFLDEAALGPVHAAGARLGVTLNGFCQAAWALVLASQSGRSDVVFATVRACRHPPGSAPVEVAGMLMNTVPVRAAIKPEETIADFLAKLRAQQLAARPDEFAALGEIQRAVGLPPGEPLCRSLLMFDHERAWERAAAILGDGHVFSIEAWPSMPVVLSVTGRRTLTAKLMADGRTMESDAADRVLRQFGHILLELARAPEKTTLGELELITPEERFRHVEVYNATAAPYPENTCLHQAFETQAARCASRAAVIASDETLTYGELDRAANRLANYLISLGVRPGGLVVIRLGSASGLVVAILAALKAGCGYVPVDPTWPEARFRQIVESTQPKAVVTLATHRMESGPRFPDVLLDRDRAAIAACSPSRPAFNTDSTAIAYIIFTSGSTGTPKGVVIDHRGAVNTISDCNARFGLGASDRLFGISAATFDLSVYDIFGPLSTGGAVVLCPAGETRSPETWRQLVDEHGVTIWNSVPQIVEMLIENAECDRPLLSSLRLVMMSGDWIPTSLPARIRQIIPAAEIWSLGGATEASIWSIARPIHGVDPTWPSIPYGRPMANQHFYVLDQQLRPCPTLVTGDLYIGGIGVAMGYWNEPERTAHSFPVHPRWKVRLYRTGDRGRFLPSNEIQFLGRKDHQVKLGGYRIELGEIEQAISRLPWIRQCVVAKLTSAAGSECLAGYVVPTEESLFDADALREHLGAILPSYMVPAMLIKLAQLPVSSNGKIDRSALPAFHPTEQTTVAWTDPEREMVALWQEVLPVTPDSPDRSFFECGGDSLLAFRLIQLIKARRGHELRPGLIFESRPTVRNLVRALAASERDGRDKASPAGRQNGRPRWLVPVCTRGTRPPFFFLGQYLDMSRHFSSDQPFYAILVGSEIRLELPERDFRALAAAILDEIQAIQPHGPYHFGGYCFAAVLAFELALQLRERNEEIGYFCMLEPSAPAAIGPPPPVRFCGLRYGLLQLRKGWATAPLQTLAKGLGRILDNIRLACIGLSTERIFHDFTPRFYDRPVDLFLCQDSPARLAPERDPRLAWRKWCGGLSVTEVMGNHRTMLREPLVQTCAPLIEARMLAAGHDAHLHPVSQGPGRSSLTESNLPRPSSGQRRRPTLVPCT
ncbi:MAG TPA: amino acid adenylation domain-containing protein [Opitutaceae bacterium]|nr:amino acid adenylation domain-containing protein [Opitutaceae bacterium]